MAAPSGLRKRQAEGRPSVSPCLPSMVRNPSMSDSVCIHLIDDDEAARDSLAFLLDCAGLSARTHVSADAFLGAAPSLEGAVVVTDVRMPGMNGIELAAHLRKTGVPVPVIVITGHADVPLAIQAM